MIKYFKNIVTFLFGKKNQKQPVPSKKNIIAGKIESNGVIYDCVDLNEELERRKIIVDNAPKWR